MNFGVSPAFEYVAGIEQWFWPFVLASAAFAIGYICGGCVQRG